MRSVAGAAVIRVTKLTDCDQVLGEDLRSRLADVIGAVHVGGGRADRTGQAFKDLLAERSSR
jgi:hypothetical protein